MSGARFLLALRQAPLGMLLIAGALAVGGVGMLVGGGYLLLTEGALSPWAGVVSILVSPAILYFVYHLIHLERWTWACLATVIALLFVSSVLRVVFTPGSPRAGLIEMAMEVAAAAYISRPGVRSRYGWPAPSP